MLAQLTGHYPREVMLIGCQPQEIDDYGGSLRPVVKTALEDALALGLDRLRQWGAGPTARAADEPVPMSSLDIEAYEAQRPSQDDACRIGDDRFIPHAL